MHITDKAADPIETLLDTTKDCLIDQEGSSVLTSATKFTEFTVKFKRPFKTRAGVEDLQLSIGQDVKITYSYKLPGAKTNPVEDVPAEDSTETEETTVPAADPSEDAEPVPEPEPIDTSISDSADSSQPVTLKLVGVIE